MSIAGGFKRFFLWEYKRASWQYDVIVLCLLAFIFLTPRTFFRDQPKPSQISLLPPENGATVYWLEPGLLENIQGPERLIRVGELLKKRDSRKHNVVRLEPIFDSEKDVKGYFAYTKP